jgi:hypothetical protein
MALLSLPQIVGYLAFILGITAFLQKSDHRLKLFNAGQSLVYAQHFILLGNLPASGSSLVSSMRSFLALRCQSLLLAAAIVAINLGVGVSFAKTPAAWLPVIASCAATIAIFTMRGVALRSVLLGCTLLWLTNNILSGSIGGTLLEVVIVAVNISTIVRMSKPAATPQTSGLQARRLPF